MGNTENGTQELESNVIEYSKASENLARSDTETAVQREVAGAHNIGNNPVSSVEIVKETGPIHEAISEDVGAEKGEQGLVDVKIMSDYGNITIHSGIVSINPVAGKLQSPQIDKTNGYGHLNNDDRECSGHSGKRKAKSKGPVASSWSLRSMSQEKLKAPEPDITVKEDTASGEKKRRGRKRQQQQQKKTTVNEFSKNKSHLKYLLRRIAYEQSLIDAYSAEGWKGQSLEKLKPEKELQHAKSHILRYKMKIRELFKRLDLSFAVGKLPESLFDSLGEIDCEDIFCAKCGSKDLTLDNDIILCDGACQRGFHQFCLEPPLLKEDIPPGDEGWLCPGCDCKVDCIDILKDFLGTTISFTDTWEKIFPEATAAGMKLDGGSGDLSDDSEDDDYDPDKHNTADKVEEDQPSSNESDYFSAPDNTSVSLNNDTYLGLPSDDSEDDDFDPSGPDHDPDEQVNRGGSSSDFSSDSEDLGALLEEDDSRNGSTDYKGENSTVGRTKGQSMNDELSYLIETSVKPVSGKRHVERLDYKKLHEETYGNSSSDSSDEDFDDTSSHGDTSSRDDTPSRKRRKNDHAKTRTPTVNSNLNSNDENLKESKQLARRARNGDRGPSGSSSKAVSASSGTKRSAQNRIGEARTQRLYASFNENHYPDKDARENLAKELDLTALQVSKWFGNARWNFNHRPRMESNATEKLPEPKPTENSELELSGAIDEKLLAKIGEENSGS